MKTYGFAVLAALFILSSLGCAKHRAVILPSDTLTPHWSVGTLEVSTKAPKTWTHVLSAGLLPSHSYVKAQHKLDKKLTHQAAKKFDADAIMNIQYWPEPGVKTTDGKIRARAEMFQFPPFSKTSA